MGFRFKDEDEFAEFLAERGLIEVTPGKIKTMDQYLQERIEEKRKQIKRWVIENQIKQNTAHKPWYKKLFGK